MKATLRHFSVSLVVTVLALLGVLFAKNWAAVGTALILMVIEVAFSFDNAIINAKTLVKLSPFWQKMFLTVGIVIAIFGMRLVFPVLLVATTSGLAWSEVIRIALHDAPAYAHYIQLAHPAIAAFGGSFLLMLTLHYFFDRDRGNHWFSFERHFQRFGYPWMAPLLAVLLVSLTASLPFNHHAAQTWRAGLLGILVYASMHILLRLIGKVAGAEGRAKHLTGWAALTSFLYLELLDASFSFDGVVGAFAITKDIILIAVGLGIGAFWVRSLTVFMVHRKVLEAYVHLEDGAHYAVGFLALAMLYSILHEVPEAVTGLGTLMIIGYSVVASQRHKRLKHESIIV